MLTLAPIALTLAPPPITWSELAKPYGHRHDNGRAHPPFDAASLVRAVTTAEVAALTRTQVGSITGAQAEGLGTAQVAAISTANISAPTRSLTRHWSSAKVTSRR